MKNLTEFSGLVLRRAAEVRAQKLVELKAQLESAPAPVAPAAEAAAQADAELSSEAGQAPAEAQDAAPADESAQSEASEEALAEAAPEASADAEQAAASADGDAHAAPEASADAGDGDGAGDRGPRVDDAALSAAVAEAMGLSEERAKYIMGALKAVGRKNLAQVRNVRVFQGETGPSGAYSVDDLHFVVDKIIVPSAARGRDEGGRGRDGKGGKGKGRDSGGRSSGGGGGGPRPGGGGGGGPRPGGRATGGFDGGLRDERPGDVPNGGLGWSLSRAPGENKRGEGRGKPAGRKGPRRGKPGGNRPDGARPAGARPGGGRPAGGNPGSDKPGEAPRRNSRRGGRGGQGKAPEVIVKPTHTSAPAAAPKEQQPQNAAPAVETNGAETK